MSGIKTIGLVAPSGIIRNYDEINQKIAFLNSNGFKVKKFYDENILEGYLADSDKKRANFFESAFLDSEVDLVLSVRGGYGAIRIVDNINYSLIKDKYYLGSSDATILLIALSQKTNVKCFHGLMITNGFLSNLKNNINIIENNTFKINLEKINSFPGAKGRLWGGNLSSLVSVLTNDSFIPKEDIILFLEDLNEPLYKLDKMFYEIYRSKLKERIKGIIFGDFYLSKEEIYPLLKQYADRFNVPAYVTNDITHKENNITIPYNNIISL